MQGKLELPTAGNHSHDMNKEEIETCIYDIQDELRAFKKQMVAWKRT
jgi:hypothetical protein